jgi:shikimate dehydrogenase
VTRLAVLGSPIAHSQSPALHTAAYAALGLDWQYDAVEVTGATLANFVASRDESWRGLSLTMPLKRDVLPLLQTTDDTATLTGAANTLLFDRTPEALTLRGFNTDVYGIVAALREAGVDTLGRVQILGGGATAASALVAVRELGATHALVSVRTPAKAAALEDLGDRVGIAVTVRAIDEPDASREAPDAVVSTLPGHGEHTLVFAEHVRASSVLFDVAYDPWPSRLAEAWTAAGGPVVSGLEMLLHQALAQVRVFVNGAPDAALPGEAQVLAAMRASIAG